MTFSKEAWREIASIYDAIIQLPFNQELAAGTLSGDRFRFYMLQDSLYLIAFSRALSVAAAKAHDTAAMVKFAESACEATLVERQLHESFFQQYEIPAEVVANTELSPSCLSYTSYLLATAYHQPYEVLVAALLPCFWIYWEVGKDIGGRAAKENPYQAWIDTCADESFGAVVREVIDIADRVQVEASKRTQDSMSKAFVRSSQLEWMFWDSAYKLEAWPV